MDTRNTLTSYGYIVLTFQGCIQVGDYLNSTEGTFWIEVLLATSVTDSSILPGSPEVMKNCAIPIESVVDTSAGVTVNEPGQCALQASLTPRFAIGVPLTSLRYAVTFNFSSLEVVTCLGMIANDFSGETWGFEAFKNWLAGFSKVTAAIETANSRKKSADKAINFLSFISAFHCGTIRFRCQIR